MTAVFDIGPICRDAQRRADILAHPTLNGVDFIEYERRPGPQFVLVVKFLKPLPQPPQSDPDGAYGLTTRQDLAIIQGGRRIVGIRALQVLLVGDHLEISVSEEGDFSDYVLALGWALQPDGTWKQTIAALDLQFSLAPINFKAGCPVDFDCRPLEICPPERRAELAIDYLAKDYASFRRLLIDLIPQLNPDWFERNPSDLGIALLELLAYEGDYLSYFQDAIANEAYLDTIRQRVSAKRHARLVDYSMHDGRNAWTFVHLNVGSGGTVPRGSKILTRITAPLRNRSAPPRVVIQESGLQPDSFDADPALRQVQVFETTFPLNVSTRDNTIFIHSWGNVDCCLPKGARAAYLYSLDPVVAGERQARRPDLAKGDFLLIEEVLGPDTGAPADADPLHRQVVQIDQDPQQIEDSTYRDRLTADDRLQVLQPGDQPLPLLYVTWRRADALSFPACLSKPRPGQQPLINISVARGNIVTADHGRTVTETFRPPAPVAAGEIFRFRLQRGPLTMQCGAMGTDRQNLSCDIRQAQPAVTFQVVFPTGPEPWEVVPNLLDSNEFSQEFVADVENDGRATLRFGDGEYGQQPVGAIQFTPTYRVGNGRAGNVGAESLAHVVQPLVAPLWPAISQVRNPLAARDGVDPETIEQVRQLAPAAFRAEQFRAVTEADYTTAARKMPEVAGAVATFRWTGSWYTVFIGVDPRDPEDLITLPGGRTRLAPTLAQRVRNFLTRYKLAGYDLEIRSAEYVPLDIAIELCVEPDYFRPDVMQAVLDALSNRVNPDGTVGFFHPDNFTFRQPVYLSAIYDAVQKVEGVLSAFVTRFQRFGKTTGDELTTGILPVGPWEIARLDNDPALMENGVLKIHAGGGK